MKTATALAIVVLLAGCATTPAPLPGAQTYSGEVRNWNARDNTVTLFQPNVGLVHLKVTPDQLNGLELNRTARVQGVPIKPAEPLVVLVPTGPMTAVPKAPAEILELNGTVTSVNPTGRLTANTDRGPITIIVASGADQRFRTSAALLVRMSVQPMDYVAAPGAGQPAAPASPTPVGTSASPTSEPGDHAVSTGRVLSVDPGGALIVEAPSGPIQVVAANPDRYRVGDVVQVRTTARATP
jgi:hypothetical protein